MVAVGIKKDSAVPAFFERWCWQNSNLTSLTAAQVHVIASLPESNFLSSGGGRK
jgi:hypothetical protein